MTNDKLTAGIVVRLIRHNVETANALESAFACVAPDVATFAANEILRLRAALERIALANVEQPQALQLQHLASNALTSSPDESKGLNNSVEHFV